MSDALRNARGARLKSRRLSQFCAWAKCDMLKVLFLCGRNRLRSPTAEQLFSTHAGVEVASAGLNPDAITPVTPELLQWADIIFVMERAQREKLQRKFRAALNGQRLICLDIPDDYEYMEPRLVGLLEAKVTRHLPGGGAGESLAK